MKKAFDVAKQSSSGCQIRAHGWSPLQVKSGKFGFMSDGKSFYHLLFCGKVKQICQQKTQKALKVEPIGDILDEMGGT